MTITEFESLDPDEFHLVPKGATGFPVLLAKAVEENIEAETAEKAKLHAADRKELPDSDFALPDKREYPINDENHARAALSMLHNASPDEQKRIKAAVHRRYPDIKIDGDDASKQTAPDKDIHRSEAESQTHAVDAGPEGPIPSPDNEDHGEPRSVSFPHGPKGDGEGDTAPSKDTHQGEAESQTHDNIEGNLASVTERTWTYKGEGDGRGSVMEDKDVDHGEEESQTKDDAEGNTSKADADSDPGSDAWEHKDVALGERAEHLASQLGDVVRTFTEREKAEGGASKSAWRVIRRIRSLLENPTLIKEIAETMDATELLKALDGLDEARRAEKKARKEAKAAKAEKRATKAAEAADEAAKAAGADEDVAKAADEQIANLQKQIDELSAKRPFVNGLGVTSILRGTDAPNAFKAFDDRVAEAEARLEKAVTDYERQQAKTELESARQQRFTAKMIAQTHGRQNGHVPTGRLGPNTTDLFRGSTLNLKVEDTAIRGV